MIPDVENGRWVTVDQGRSATVPMPTGLVAWDALIGPGDVVYVAAFTSTPDGPANPEVLAFDAADLSTIVARSPIQTQSGMWMGLLRFDGKAVVLVGRPGEEQRFPLARPAPDTMATIAQLDATSPGASLGVTAPNGSTTTWVFEEATFLNDVVPLPGGAVAVRVNARTDTFSATVWVLRPDGTYAGREVVAEPNSLNGRLSVSERGIVALQLTPNGWRVTRFALPS